MIEFLISIAVLLAWVVLWALAATLLTLLISVASGVMEHYLVLSDTSTFPLWALALSFSPAVAFVASWTLWGALLSERFYASIRYGCLGAGIVFTVVGIVVVTSTGEREDRTGEVPTLIGSLISVVLCCAALVGYFPAIAGYMQSLGGG